MLSTNWVSGEYVLRPGRGEICAYLRSKNGRTAVNSPRPSGPPPSYEGGWRSQGGVAAMLSTNWVSGEYVLRPGRGEICAYLRSKNGRTAVNSPRPSGPPPSYEGGKGRTALPPAKHQFDGMPRLPDCHF